jgi:hypothetical protein
LTLARLEDVDRAAHVCQQVTSRVLHRHADIDLRGEVKDPLGPFGLEDLADRHGIDNVDEPQLRAALERAAEIPLAPAGKVIDDRDVIATVKQRIDKGRADEAGTAGDQRSHAA